jgi:hypothetical protein
MAEAKALAAAKAAQQAQQAAAKVRHSVAQVWQQCAKGVLLPY